MAESLAALAAAGGTAVVQAAGTDAWSVVRERLARLVGRGDAGREAAELHRLDETGRALAGGGPGSEELVRWESSWQTRIELFLDGLPAQEQAAAAAELRYLVEAARAAGATCRDVSAGEGGVAVGGDVSVEATSGSVAGAVVHVEGGIHLPPFVTESPRQPPPDTDPRR